VLLDEILRDIPRVMGEEAMSATIATESDLRQYRWRRTAHGDDNNDPSRHNIPGIGRSPPKLMSHPYTILNFARSYNSS
jgi:hypothetical protein